MSPLAKRLPILRKPLLGTAAVMASAALLLGGCALDSETTTAEAGSLAKDASLDGASITVGSKEFTEQLILCEITAQALESAGADVERNCGLTGSDTTRTALTSGEIDLYWEYTGTAWIGYLKHTDPVPDATRQYKAVAREDLAENPDIAKVMNPIAAELDEEAIQQLNAQVDIQGLQPEDAAQTWLQKKGFIGN
jgi:glycine betaine/choline ABC-type transport system substrate-binding protein